MRILVASFQVWYGTVLSPATRWTRVVTCSRRLPKPLPIYGDLSLSHFTGSSIEENINSIFTLVVFHGQSELAAALTLFLSIE
jgi:hypothetical protein